MANDRSRLLPALAQAVIIILVVPLAPLLISRRWRWWEAWLFAGVSIFGFVISRLVVARRHPDLLAERLRFTAHADIKAWDKPLATLVGLGGAMVPIAAGIEALWPERAFGWPVKTASAAALLAGYALGAAALAENRFFSGIVRIQHDRGHHVVSGGPYRWVRHPGYAGAILAYLATPLLLDSLWAGLCALLLGAVLVVRTRLEDATLLAELEGYAEYARRVRYRLLPGVW